MESEKTVAVLTVDSGSGRWTPPATIRAGPLVPTYIPVVLATGGKDGSFCQWNTGSVSWGELPTRVLVQVSCRTMTVNTKRGVLRYPIGLPLDDSQSRMQQSVGLSGKTGASDCCLVSFAANRMVAGLKPAYKLPWVPGLRHPAGVLE